MKSFNEFVNESFNWMFLNTVQNNVNVPTELKKFITWLKTRPYKDFVEIKQDEYKFGRMSLMIRLPKFQHISGGRVGASNGKKPPAGFNTDSGIAYDIKTKYKEQMITVESKNGFTLVQIVKN